LLNPKVIADLDLARHGLKVVERKVFASLLARREWLSRQPAEGRTYGEAAKFSPKGR